MNSEANGQPEQRDSLGRFRKGNSGGPGCRGNHRLREFRESLAAAVSPSDLEAVFAKLLEAALAGDVAAIRTLLDRCLGRAELPIEVHGSHAVVLSDEERKDAERIIGRRWRRDPLPAETDTGDQP